MIKQLPSRNHRSKGIKVKHVLQIILLLGVCFWLIYQVKHSHDKNKEFDENDSKLSARSQTAYQTPKLGRKDLHPGNDEVNRNEKHEEDEEDENIVDDEDKHERNEHEGGGNLHESEEKEDDKHGLRRGEEEQVENENKSEEMDDERGGGGDDEIDENDREQSAVDTDRDEEFMDEEKEKEKQNSDNEEKDGSVENHNSHEAREEHYKGDDASSAVTHGTHTTSTETETETVSLENSYVSSEMNITNSENKPNYTEESDRNQNNSNINITVVELTGGTSSNATSGKETGSNSLSNAVDISHLDNITATFSDGHSEASSNLTVLIPGGTNNMTGASADTSSEQNKIVIYSESNQAQNGTVNTTVTGDVKNGLIEGDQGGNRVSEENLTGPDSTVSVKTEIGNAASGDSSNLEGGHLEKTTRFVASNKTETKVNTETSTQNISYMKDNTDATKNEEFKGGMQTDQTSDSSSVEGTSGSVEHHDTTDSSDSHILKDVAEVRTDLDTLPDIRKEGDNGVAAATD